MGLPPGLAAASVCYLETTGRSTGKPRVVEIWFAVEGTTIYLLSGGRERAHWVRNLQADPRARLRVQGRTYPVAAAFVEGTSEDPTARRVLAAKYQGWQDGAPLSRWARESLPVALRLDPDVAAAS